MRAAGRVFITALALNLCTGIVATPAASARGRLVVGMPITIGRHKCTLGFFGLNSRDDHLAVTSGHCSDQIPDQYAYAGRGVRIGKVVAWKRDAENSAGDLTGVRGYTVIALYKTFSLEPFFTDTTRHLEVGDYVTKYGERTGKTKGRITEVSTVEGRPDLSLVYSNMVQLPGDSGCPWVTNGRTLVAMGSSGNQEREGGDAGSQAQPIGAVIDMIRKNPTVWGDDFKVWTE